MYRSKTRRTVQLVTISAVLALGATTAGVAIAGASPHHSHAKEVRHDVVAQHLQTMADGVVSPSTPTLITPTLISPSDSTSPVASVSVEGTVLSATGSTIQITSSDGTTDTINVAPATTFRMNDAVATFADVAIGSSIEVSGVASSTPGTFDATSITIDQVSTPPVSSGGTSTQNGDESYQSGASSDEMSSDGMLSGTSGSDSSNGSGSANTANGDM
jgi:hypothetical protein